jgi:hypothetical protein
MKVMRDELEANIKALELDVIGFLNKHLTPEYFGPDYKIYCCRSVTLNY